jgi:predicted PurR-regulated permease PerM
MPGPSGTSGPHFTLPPSIEEGATAVVVERVIPPTLDWRQTVVLTLAGAAIAAVGIGLVWHRQLGLLLFGGIVLATAMNPFIEWFIRRLKMARVHAAILVYSLLVVVLVGLVALIVPETIAQAQAFWHKLPGWYDQTRDLMQASSNRTLRSIGARVPEHMPQFWNLGWLNSGMGSVNSSPLDVLGQVGAGILGVLAVGVLGFYWSVNEELTVGSLLQLAPDHRREFYQSLIDELLKKLGGYIRGQLILCAAVGVISLIAYFFIGLPYALLLALIAGVLEAVPIIGPTLGAVPAILVAMSLGPQQTVLVIGAAMLIQTLENYLLVPKIMDRSVGIGAVVTLLAIVVCGALFGLVGAIFAIPLAAVTQTLFERFVLQADFKDKEFTATRDSAGVLHYQLLELINDVKRKQREKDSPVDPWTTETFAEIETLAVALDELVVTTEDGELPAPLPLATVTSR